MQDDEIVIEQPSPTLPFGPPVPVSSDEDADRRGWARSRRLLIAVGALGIIVVLSLGGIAMLWSDPDPGGVELVIPEGAAAKLDYPTIDTAIDVPTNMVFEQGQVLTIRNEDTTANRAGPWVLAAGETLRMRFDTPGEFFYLCTVNESRSVTVTVVEDE